MANLNLLFDRKASLSKHLEFFQTYSFVCVLFSLICCSGWSNNIAITKKTTTVSMLRLKMSGLPNYLDETVIYYQTGATSDFDNEYDSYKISGPNPTPQISQKFNSTLLSINGIEPVTQTFSINILVTTPITGSFTITATDFQQLPLGTCVYLQDLLLGTTTNILTNSYTFNLSNTTTISRFILQIYHLELPISSEIIQPTCQFQNAGKIKIIGDNYGPWNYTWKDSTGTTIKTLSNSFIQDSIDNLSEGLYNLEIASVSNSCYSRNESFNINKINIPAVAFNVNDTTISNISQSIALTNLSENCTSYYWNFGDGNGYSYNTEPNYYYSTIGIYKTTLIGTSSTGCVDSSSKYIHVVDPATSTKELHQSDIELISLGNKIYKIKFNKNFYGKIDINLYNIEGEIYSKFTIEYNYSENTNIIDLSNYKSGIFILDIKHQNESVKHLKFIIM